MARDLLGDRAQAAAATQERQPQQAHADDEQRATADAERDDDQQRPAQLRIWMCLGAAAQPDAGPQLCRVHQHARRAPGKHRA